MNSLTFKDRCLVLLRSKAYVTAKEIADLAATYCTPSDAVTRLRATGVKLKIVGLEPGDRNDKRSMRKRYTLAEFQ